MLPGALVLSGLVLRFFFTGVGYIAYAMFFYRGAYCNNEVLQKRG